MKFKPSRPPGSTLTLGPFIYTLDKDSMLTIELDTIEKFYACSDEIHTTVEPTIVPEKSFVTQTSEGWSVKLESDSSLIQYGLSISGNPNQMRLQVDSQDTAMSHYQFDITLTSYVKEEPAWRIETLVQLIYIPPWCLLTQFDIDVDPKVEIVIGAKRGQKDATLSLKELFSQGMTTLRAADPKQYCGNVTVEFIDENDDHPFIEVDLEKEEMKLSSSLLYAAATYDTTYLKFYYAKNEALKIEQELVVTMKILATIQECTYTSIKFTAPSITIDYVLGKESLDVDLPDFQMTPLCGFDTEISKSVLVANDALPGGAVLDDILEFDMGSKILRVLSNKEFSLIGSQISAKLTLQFADSSLSPQSILVYINLVTNGPEFASAIPSPPAITCSALDSNWLLQLPEIIAAEQQEVMIQLTQPPGDYFVFDDVSGMVTLSEGLLSGDVCPAEDTMEVMFELDSDILGISYKSATIQVDVHDKVIRDDPDSEAMTEIGDFNVTQTEGKGKNKFPHVNVTSIQVDGLLVLKFSDPFDRVEDLSRFKRTYFSNDPPSLEIYVPAVEGQSEGMVSVQWEPLSFTSTELVVQLFFDRPSDISAFDDPNIIVLKIWDGTLFVRTEDQMALPDNYQTDNMLPKQLEAGMAAKIKTAGELLVDVGTNALFIFAVLSFFMNFGMNNVLAQVRSLQLITHLMMMQLGYPASSSLFFGTIFSYVTFDLVPTETLYAQVFAFNNVSYSEQAENVGYESLYIIENTGSFLIYILIIIVEQIFFAIIIRATTKKTRCNSWASSKRSSFFWAGSIDFISELYLNIAFSVGMNMSDFNMDDVTHAVRFNNVFLIVCGITLVIVPIKIVCSLYHQMKQSQENLNEQLEGGSKDDIFAGVDENQAGSQDSQTGTDDSYESTDENQSNADDKAAGSDENQEGIDNNQAGIDITQVKEEEQEDAESPSPVINKKQRQRYMQAIDQHQKADAELKARHGGFVETLTHRMRLSSNMVAFFVLWSYLRRLLLAVVIVGIYSFPSVQITSALMLTLINTAILVSVRPHGSGPEQRAEILNEFATLLIFYCLMLFTGHFVTDNEKREYIGQVTIGITCLNFFINSIPIFFQIYSSIKRCCQKLIYTRRLNQALELRYKKQIQKCRNQTQIEQVYAQQLEVQHELAAYHKSQFPRITQNFVKGHWNNLQCAIRYQWAYDQERDLEEAYENKPLSLIQEVSTISKTYLRVRLRKIFRSSIILPKFDDPSAP